MYVSMESIDTVSKD